VSTAGTDVAAVRHGELLSVWSLGSAPMMQPDSCPEAGA
jgi:hypothetical protein